MKKLLYLIALFSCLSGHAQNWTKVYGSYEYQSSKIDSAIYLPSGNTATRKAPVSGAYWVRFNTDSAGFEFSDGTKWYSFSPKPPTDLTIDTLTGVRDTTLPLTCGTLPTTYWHTVLTQYIGFRIRAIYNALPLSFAPNFFCSVGIWGYSFNSLTGDFYFWGAPTSGFTDLMISGY